MASKGDTGKKVAGKPATPTAAGAASPPPPPKDLAKTARTPGPGEDGFEERITGQDVKACFKVSENKPNGDYKWQCLSCTSVGWSTPNAIMHLKACDEAQKRPEVQRVLKYYKPRNRKTMTPAKASGSGDAATPMKPEATPAKVEPAKTTDSTAKKSRTGDENRVDGKDVRNCFKVTEVKPNGDYKWTCLSCPAQGWSTAEAVTHLRGCKDAQKRDEVKRVIELYKPRKRRSTADADGARSAKIRRSFGQVAQTDFTPSKGNALQACVASILGLGLDEVPNFIAMPGDMYENLREFLATHGLGFMRLSLDNHGHLPFAPAAKKIHCLLAGDSPHGDHRHVVVAEVGPNDTKVTPVFDPHPSGQFLTSQTWVGLFIALDPANVTAD